METPILIVGAGPTGLVLALWLAQFGIPLRIIDKSDGPGETSRAMVVHARTLELYQQIGIAQEVVSKGIITNRIHMREMGREVASADLKNIGKGLSPFPFLLTFPQDDHEKVLIEHLLKFGITVERKTELLSFMQTSTNVQATLKTESGTETLEASYLCGCDGARSTVRTNLKMDFPGGTYSQIFYVADAKATGEAANGDFQLCMSQYDFCLVLPVRSSGTFRLIGIAPPGKENVEKITFGDVKSAVVRDTKLTINEVNWFSTYRVHHRVAQQFRCERIFLLGDAAHIHSPLGGQGMNTGIGDAINFAWKLAAVLQKRASPDILDSYQVERKAFAETLVSTTDKLFQTVTNRGLFGMVFHKTIFPFMISILLRLQFVKRFFFKTVSQIKIKYRQSSLSQGAVNHIHGGDRLPWVTYGDTDNFVSLRLLDWQVHVYGEAKDDFKKALREMNITLTILPWDKRAEEVGLQKGAVYLLRPDGYLSYVDANQNSEGLKSYLQRFQIVPRSVVVPAHVD